MERKYHLKLFWWIWVCPDIFLSERFYVCVCVVCVCVVCVCDMCVCELCVRMCVRVCVIIEREREGSKLKQLFPCIDNKKMNHLRPRKQIGNFKQNCSRRIISLILSVLYIKRISSHFSLLLSLTHTHTRAHTSQIEVSFCLDFKNGSNSKVSFAFENNY